MVVGQRWGHLPDLGGRIVGGDRREAGRGKMTSCGEHAGDAEGESFGEGSGRHQSPGRTLCVDTRMSVPGDSGRGHAEPKGREDEEGGNRGV